MRPVRNIKVMLSGAGKTDYGRAADRINSIKVP